MTPEKKTVVTEKTTVTLKKKRIIIKKSEDQYLENDNDFNDDTFIIYEFKLTPTPPKDYISSKKTKQSESKKQPVKKSIQKTKEVKKCVTPVDKKSKKT